MKKNYSTPVTHLLALDTPSYLQPYTVKSYNTEKAQQIGDTEATKKRNLWSE